MFQVMPAGFGFSVKVLETQVTDSKPVAYTNLITGSAKITNTHS